MRWPGSARRVGGCRGLPRTGSGWRQAGASCLTRGEGQSSRGSWDVYDAALDILYARHTSADLARRAVMEAAGAG